MLLLFSFGEASFQTASCSKLVLDAEVPPGMVEHPASCRSELPMSPLLPIGLAIVLNVTVLGVGLAWSKRQLRRVAAEREAQYRGLFKLVPLPPPGEKVLILVEDDDGKVSEIDAVHWPQLGWTDAITMLRVDDDVLGWRQPPFRAPAAVDHSTWSREQLERGLARLVSNDDGST